MTYIEHIKTQYDAGKLRYVDVLQILEAEGMTVADTARFCPERKSNDHH